MDVGQNWTSQLGTWLTVFWIILNLIEQMLFDKELEQSHQELINTWIIVSVDDIK